jgi:hypothetical protein
MGSGDWRQQTTRVLHAVNTALHLASISGISNEHDDDDNNNNNNNPTTGHLTRQEKNSHG